jgi:DNA-binding NtrC family response regulator
MPVPQPPGVIATVSPSDYTPQPRKSSVSATAPVQTKILSVSSNGEDHSALQHILAGQSIQVSTFASCKEALEYLGRDGALVIFCDHSMEDGTWQDLLNRVSTVAEPPLVVVTSRLADDRLWAEVLNLGGWDVLAKPFHEREVLHVLDSAWNHKANPFPLTRIAGAA